MGLLGGRTATTAWTLVLGGLGLGVLLAVGLGGRLQAQTAKAIRLIEPAGFVMTDRAFRRAGMDYLDKAALVREPSWTAFRHATAGRRSVLMTTGANDPRVAPWQSRKMIAALQAAQGGAAPILLRTSASSGHGAGTAMDERIDAGAHIRAFILDQLGIQ